MTRSFVLMCFRTHQGGAFVSEYGQCQWSLEGSALCLASEPCTSGYLSCHVSAAIGKSIDVMTDFVSTESYVEASKVAHYIRLELFIFVWCGLCWANVMKLFSWWHEFSLCLSSTFRYFLRHLFADAGPETPFCFVRQPPLFRLVVAWV